MARQRIGHEQKGEAKDPDEAAQIAKLKRYSLNGVEFSYKESIRILEQQRLEAEAYDTKASILIGFIGIILTILIREPTEIQLLLNSSSTSPMQLFGYEVTIQTIFFFLALLALFFSAFCSFVCISLRGFDTVPSPARLNEKYLSWEPLNIMYKILPTLVRVYSYNGKLVAKKASWIMGCLISLGASVLLLILIYINNIVLGS